MLTKLHRQQKSLADGTGDLDLVARFEVAEVFRADAWGVSLSGCLVVPEVPDHHNRHRFPVTIVSLGLRCHGIQPELVGLSVTWVNAFGNNPNALTG